MTDKENIKAILECYFTGFKEEIIDSACNRILEQEPYGKDINVPATDCISRQAVKELFQEACEMEMYDFLGIDDIPSVTPQESVLDKMRTEVKALPNANPSYSGYIDVVDREDVLEIIDKYKADKEKNNDR